KAVITGKDTLGIKYGTIDVPQYPADKNPLAMDKVRYIGDEVAAVAAIDEDTAEEALDLIEVEYEELPAVFDPEEAMKPDAPKIHDGGNICARISWNFGDVEKGFKESDYVREDRFATQAIAHCAMEPHAALASFDSSGKLTVWCSTQAPYMRRTQLSKTLGIRESMIRVLYTHVGGGFGGKTLLCEPEFQAALLSKVTGCPVKIAYTREEVFACTMQRHPMVLQLKTGVKKDGALIATQCKIIADGGAYAATGPVVMYLAGAFLVTVYRLSNVSYEGYRMYTNKPIRGPQRGHGAVQPRFAFDSQLDMVAEELGMDPMEIRLKNAVRSGDVTPNRFKIRGCGLTETIEKSCEMARWKEKRGKMPGNRGIGMCCGTFISGMLIPPHTSSGAFVKVHEDGGVTLIAGIPEIGQRSDTIPSQIVADELGIALEDVQVVSGDTEITPLHAGSYSSRGMWASKAVKAAALDAKRQLFEVVAKELEANPEDLEARDRRIYVKGSPEKGMSFKEAVLASYMSKEGNPILGRGYYKPDIDLVNFETGEGNLSPDYSFGTQIAEVEVDKETGKVKLLRMTVGHDVGLAINPMAVEGQTEGSISMGQGQVLYEE
ncbi:MAG: xanthine dehydrogenase family protein molybdopterin-binding subunit, partial [Dehalococcoidia bacterium]|nr:xanthine dehydrogenase family protein molybdopterin-binding subunit [Dehalococcoidia bacterium]